MRERSDMPETAECAQSGLELLEDMKDRLSLEGRELQRMEYEGGLPLKPTQKAQANACLKASQRIKTILRAMHKKQNPRKTPSNTK